MIESALFAPCEWREHRGPSPPPLALELPVDGWLRGLAFELVDEKGEQLPGMLHHLNLIVPDHRELFSQIMLRIGAAGPETRALRPPLVPGLPGAPGDSSW